MAARALYPLTATNQITQLLNEVASLVVPGNHNLIHGCLLIIQHFLKRMNVVADALIKQLIMCLDSVQWIMDSKCGLVKALYLEICSIVLFDAEEDLHGLTGLVLKDASQALTAPSNSIFDEALQSIQATIIMKGLKFGNFNSQTPQEWVVQLLQHPLYEVQLASLSALQHGHVLET